MEILIHGNPDDYSGWDDSDIKMLSGKNLKSTEKALGGLRLKGRANIVFVNCDYDHNDAEFVNSIEAVDGINVTLFDNISAFKYPLTPWIIIHRMHHALLGRRVDCLDVFEYLENEIIIAINATANPTFTYMLATACTMSSARNKRLNPVSADVAAELFAQYLITGDIKFKKAADWEFDNFSLGPIENYPDQIPRLVYKENNNRHLIRLQGEFTSEQQTACDEILDRYKDLIINQFEEDIKYLQNNHVFW